MDQDVCLFSRKRMDLTGIDEVETFTEDQIILESSLGMISIEGKNLKIESFSTENGQLKIIGEIDSFFYYNKKSSEEKQSFLSKLFK